MTSKEAITAIELAIAEVEWDYPIDYTIAFMMAKDALKSLEEPEQNGYLCAIHDMFKLLNSIEESVKSGDFSMFEQNGSSMPLSKEIDKLLDKYGSVINLSSYDSFDLQ